MGILYDRAKLDALILGINERCNSGHFLRIGVTNQKMKTLSTAIFLRLRILGTTRARSPCFHSMMANTMVNTAQPISVPITSAEAQDLVMPAHSRAREKQMSEPVSSIIPGKSSLSNSSLNGIGTGFACSGGLKKSRRVRNAAPPIGRLT